MKRLILAALMALPLATSACYERPTCAFRCGEADNACPYEYFCASDGRCKLKGVADDHQCPADEGRVDAETERDAGTDDAGS